MIKKRISFKNYISIYIVILLQFNYIRQYELNQSLAMNVTRLLDKLLTNYSKSLRPTHELGIPTIIDTNIRINSLGPISNFDMVNLVVV
jgi:hypothetical protein